MRLISVFIIVGLVISSLPGHALAAETTTEIYCTNKTTKNIMMRLMRMDDLSSQVVAVPANEGMEIFYDYPTAYFLNEANYYYKLLFYHEDKSDFDCAIGFKISNMYILWPTIIDAKIETLSGSSCDAFLDVGLLVFGVRMYVELK